MSKIADDNVRLTKKEQSELTDQERLILFYRNNPCVAIADIFGIELTWFQRICVRALWTKKFVILLLSRGLSKTYLSAVVLSLYGILYPRTRIGVIAPSYRQTFYLLDYIEELYETSAFFRNACYRGVTRGNMRSIIRFKNGSFIEALPVGDGKKIRGRRYNMVYIDEYAQMDDTIVRLVILPMMNIKKRGIENRMLMGSTAYWAFNHFYLTYVSYRYAAMGNPKEYEVCEFDIDDLRIVPDPPFELDEKMIMRMKNDPNTTEEEFLMEYYCKFPVGGQGFISPNLVKNCTPSALSETYMVNFDGSTYFMEGSPVELSAEQGATYVAGVDVARSAKGDNFAVVIIKIDQEKFRIVNCYGENGLSFQEMTKIIRIYCVDFNLSLMYMDASGGGSAIKDLLAQKWTDDRTNKAYPPIIDIEDKNFDNVPGLRCLVMKNFTQPFVNFMYHTVKGNMQHGRVLFPIDRRKDPNKLFENVCHNLIQLKQELVMLRAESKGLLVTFTTGSKQKKDRATALGLANLAAVEFKKDVLISESLITELPTGGWVAG